MRLARILLPLLVSVTSAATVADYERAEGLRAKYQSLAENLPERANWLEGSSRFWYRRAMKGGTEFILFDAVTLEKKPAFNHALLAEALSKATGETYEPLKLPFATVTFSQDATTLEFNTGDSRWKANLTDYSLQKLGPARSDLRNQSSAAVASPDGKSEAFVRNYNVFIRSKGGKEEGAQLSFDGSEGNYYEARSIVWSPDSAKLAAYRIRTGYRRKIHYIESSPLDQLQPKYSTIDYAKPGDELDLQQPVLFHLDSKKQLNVINDLFRNPYQLGRLSWWKDSRGFTFEYNQRGHQLYRVIEVAAASGAPRVVIDEAASTFFCYSGKKFRHDLGDGREIVWMSERDGWNHLYLYDGLTGSVKGQITRGNWVVRGVEKVDEQRRQIWFRASGMDAGKDPYFVHYFRINFDGSGLTRLTETDANHAVAFSSDMQFFVDTWSRIDQPPVSELRRTNGLMLVTEIERGKIEELKQAGWRPPEVFTGVGRDGKTEIWGVIIRPTSFDPAKKYPVIEYIYAGPQDSFVPKSFSAWNPMQSLAELGFVVVQIDGMGTSNRSKAFHDVCWKNLADAGFPDRILWHKAVAAKYPWYDISKVGVYGHSAGAQNALGGLLFHGDFYKAAVASCGCHDNRMDKIWWNEQWMGWPLGPEYIACSNVENAHKLRGKLLLTVGEMDSNVDPASTMQVVNALVKAGKMFDLLVIPGQGHTPGGPYGDRKRFDFFVHHLLGQEPPDWNVLDKKLPEPPAPRRPN